VLAYEALRQREAMTRKMPPAPLDKSP
jgi:hypothetical protein